MFHWMSSASTDGSEGWVGSALSTPGAWTVTAFTLSISTRAGHMMCCNSTGSWWMKLQFYWKLDHNQTNLPYSSAIPSNSSGKEPGHIPWQCWRFFLLPPPSFLCYGTNEVLDKQLAKIIYVFKQASSDISPQHYGTGTLLGKGPTPNQFCPNEDMTMLPLTELPLSLKSHKQL